MGFAEFLREALRVRGWSTYRLSMESGVPPSTIKGWLYGDREPIMSNALKVANAFGLSVEELYSAADYEIKGRVRKAIETPEEIVERLRVVQPVSIPVYREFQVLPSGVREEPVRYIFRRRELVAGRNIEAYIIKRQYMKLEISDGDVALVDRDLLGEAGDMVLCLFEGETILGKLEFKGGELWLFSNGRSIRLRDCEVSAKVVEMRKKFE